MLIRPRVSTEKTKKKRVCEARRQDAATCSCTESCSGYASRDNCPPLIVLAVLALQDEIQRIAAFPLVTVA